MSGIVNHLNGGTHESDGRSEMSDRVWTKALTLAKAAAREHTQSGPFPSLIKQVVFLQDDYNLDKRMDKEDLQSWFEKQAVDQALIDRLDDRARIARYDTTSVVEVGEGNPLFDATCRPSALRVFMDGMSSQEYASFAQAILGGTKRFTLKVRGDPTGPLRRALEFDWTKVNQGDDESRKTLSISLPLTAYAAFHYSRVYRAAENEPDGSLIPREIAWLDSSRRKNLAKAAIAALQTATEVFLNGEHTSWLESIKLQDMISLADTAGDCSLDPFKLFTGAERRTGEALVLHRVLDTSLVKQRKPHAHWTGFLNQYDLHAVAQALEGGETVFTADIQVEGGLLMRTLHANWCGEYAAQSVFTSEALALALVATRGTIVRGPRGT